MENTQTKTEERRVHNARRSEAYARNQERSIKVRQIGNGYLVTEFNGEPMAYPELGAAMAAPEYGHTPLTVAEHIAAFFGRAEGDANDDDTE